MIEPKIYTSNLFFQKFMLCLRTGFFITWLLILITASYPQDSGGSLNPLQLFEKQFIKIVRDVHDSVVTVEILEQKRVYSGVILNQEGYIATMVPVLSGSEKIFVLGTGERVTAQLVGQDPRTNLVILKIKAPNLSPVVRRDSNEIEVGAVLIIVGNPYGLEKSVAYGIVSGKNRTVKMENGDVPLPGIIQTTLPLNPGDTGGLIVDSNGKFVGMGMACATLPRIPPMEDINGTMYNALGLVYKLEKEGSLNHAQVTELVELISKNFRSKPVQGISFVLPASTIYWVADQIIQRGQVYRGWAGLEVKDNENGTGVLVTKVSPGSPAWESGLKEGDHIVMIDGEPIPNSDFLLYKISHTLAEQKVFFVVIREDKKQNIVLTLIKIPPK